MLERSPSRRSPKPVGPAKTRQELEARLIAKAWTNPEFKAKLLANPNKALREELGADLPPGLEVRVVEETPDRFFLRVPAKPEEAERSSLETLQAWAGGEDPNPFLSHPSAAPAAGEQ